MYAINPESISKIYFNWINKKTIIDILDLLNKNRV